MNTEPNALLEFFLHISTLNSTPRTGWLWRGVKNPETIAEHCFRTAFFAWVLGSKTNLGQEKLLPMVLTHELCEVYAGDMTPYYDIAPEDGQEKQEMLRRWIRLSQKEKKSLSKKKFEIEKEGMEKVIGPLSARLRARIMSHWLEYETNALQGGSFVYQIDKIEALLQAIEYFGPQNKTFLVGWWESIEEVASHPVLLKFLKTIEHKLYYQKDTDMDGELAFLIEVGKLKRMPWKEWERVGVKYPDSIANHVFSHALMSWVFSWEVGGILNRERIIKMCLAQRLCRTTLNGGDVFYDGPLVNRQWIRSSTEEKQAKSEERYQQEEKVLKTIVATLDDSLQKEILSCKKEYAENKTSEARFVNQVYVLEVLLRAFQYKEEDKSFNLKPWWEWASESIDNPVFAKFMDAMDKRFSVS
ncbi:MAG: HD domain-containing protein [bacterium]|nr:HD domain-containing protein [bacterium]